MALGTLGLSETVPPKILGVKMIQKNVSIYPKENKFIYGFMLHWGSLSTVETAYKVTGYKVKSLIR